METHQKKLRAIAEFLVVGICTLAFVLAVGGISASLLAKDAAGRRDFVEYWASGHQLVHRANPYDGNAILRLERSVGLPSGTSDLIMPNPPSALLLVFPLGFLGATAGELLWSLLLLGCLVASVRIVWIMHGRPRNQLSLLGYSFGPALVCLLVGQVSVFVLLGLVLFLHLCRSRPFLAGLSLWLCMLKPHLFLPFGIALILWVITTRSYKVFWGATVAVGISTAFAFALDPFVWSDYRQMMVAGRMFDRMAIPCLSIMLRRVVNPNSTWIQYFPAVIGSAWALAFFRKHSQHWDWLEHGSPLVLVSVVVAPYSWITDQAIVIPALLHALYLTRSRSLVAILALASALVQVGIFQGGTRLLHSALYLWTAPAWLAWYLYAVYAVEPRSASDAALAVEGREASL